MSTRDKVLHIEAGRAARGYGSELWRHRELLLFLARKDILVRYQQTAIGVAWVLLKPALTLLIFTLVFGRLANLPSGEVPYSILVITGLLPWLFFSSSISDAGDSLLASSALVTKVYFPRMIVPAGAMLAGLVDFLIAAVLLVALMLYHGIYPDARLLALPLLVALLAAAAAGCGLWLSALTVKYRDFRAVTPFIVQVGLYASPVGYSSALVPEPWRALFYLNPMAGIIDGFRWALLGAELHGYGLAVSVVLSLLLLATGVLYFRKVERTLADAL